MRRVVSLCVAFSFPLLAGCPSNAVVCRSSVDQVCERVFECQSDEAKASPAFQAAFGTSMEDCKDKLEANPLRPKGATGIACADVNSEQQLCTNSGLPNATKFNLSKASECRDARAKLACADYLAQLPDPSKAPTPCADVCSQ